jgi:hypothetical protein
LPVLVLGVTHSSHFRYWALPVPVRSFTGPRTGTGLYARGPISGTGLCQFRYGHSLGPVPELDSMRVVPYITALKRRVRKRFSLGFGITLLVTEQVPSQKTKKMNGQRSAGNGISHFRYWYRYWKWDCHFRYW